MSKATFSQILLEVVEIMNTVLCPQYIKFPSEAEMKIIIDRYLKLYIAVILLCNVIDNLLSFRKVHPLYKIPGIFGFIDGTHINIVGPGSPRFPEFVFINRKNYHSINVQIVR